MNKKRITDFKYFMKKTANHSLGEYGKCAVCGKRTMKIEIAFGFINRFHLCSPKHRELFLSQTTFGKLL
jgi:ssDNA-binding Zn-finger/Zn-ribbon topoisomerase 1